MADILTTIQQKTPLGFDRLLPVTTPDQAGSIAKVIGAEGKLAVFKENGHLEAASISINELESSLSSNGNNELIQTINISGTYTLTHGKGLYLIELWGGGGGGGRGYTNNVTASSYNTGGSGGGSGGYLIFLAYLDEDNFVVNIGAGGLGASLSAGINLGTDGGETIFTTEKINLTAKGGTRGVAGTNTYQSFRFSLGGISGPGGSNGESTGSNTVVSLYTGGKGGSSKAALGDPGKGGNGGNGANGTGVESPGYDGNPGRVNLIKLM